MADVMEVDSTETDIEFVKHAVIANAELALAPSTQTLVSKRGQTQTHVVNLALNGSPNGSW